MSTPPEARVPTDVRCEECGKVLWSDESRLCSMCVNNARAAAAPPSPHSVPPPPASAPRVRPPADPPTPEPVVPSTPVGYITVLGDAYLVPSSVGSDYIVYGQGSGAVLCHVPTDVAQVALGNPQAVVPLGSWPAWFRGRQDTWTLWYCIECVWAATGDVQTSHQAAPLIDAFAAEVERAEAEGRIHSPSPPPNAPPPPQPRSPRPSALTFGGAFRSSFKSGLGRGRRLRLR